MSRDESRDEARLSRARGVLLGQCVGDALGAQFEFSPALLLRGQDLARVTGGGPHDTLPGQVTDDSELALALARSIALCGDYDQEDAARAYVDWYGSEPFDCGGTTARALSGVDLDLPLAPQVRVNSARGNMGSEANGSLMRASPLGVLLARTGQEWSDSSDLDSALTHPNALCRDACRVYCEAIASLVTWGDLTSRARVSVWEDALRTAGVIDSSAVLVPLLRRALYEPVPQGVAADGPLQGWVGIALQNAFHQLLYARSFRSGVTDSIALGGDTDTNAAIAGALLGAYFGEEGVPTPWAEAVRACRPPRPRTYWADDLPSLAEALLLGGTYNG